LGYDEYKEVFKSLMSDVKGLIKGYGEEVRIVVAGDLVHQK
jgi:hypothetical protein